MKLETRNPKLEGMPNSEARNAASLDGRSFISILSTLLTVFALASQALAAEPDAARVREIAGMLSPKPAGFGRPIIDRATRRR